MYSKLILTIAFTFYLGFVFSQNWTGNINSDWNNPSNWSTAPINGSDITIDPTLYTGASASPIIGANSTFSPGAILITNGGDLTISANLTTSSDVEVIGLGSSITMTNGTFSVNVGNGGILITDFEASLTLNAGSVVVGERFIVGVDALVTVNGGSASTGERLIMDGGGRFIQNGGNVSVGATFAMADGSANYNSSYILNDGNLTISGGMGFENEAGNFEPTFEQFDGNLLLNGDMFWFGEAPGLGTPKCLFHGGNASINGTIENLPLSTVNMYFKMDGIASVDFNGTRWETIQAIDSVILTGNSSLKLQNTHSIINEGVWFGEVNSSALFQGVTNLQGTGEYQFKHVFINGSTPSNSLNHLTTSPLKISGDLFNYNMFSTNLNKVVFNGTQDQAIFSDGNLAFHDLEINNTSSVGVITIGSIFSTYTVQGHLELTDGKFIIQSTETLKLLDNATSSVGNASSFVDGAMYKIGNDPFTFPVGKNEKWGAIAITAPANLNSEFKAEYFDAGHPTPTPVNSPISSISGAEYWQLDQTVGTDNVTVQLFWDNAQESLIADCNELSIASWNGASWDNVLGTSAGSCLAQDAGALVSNVPLSSFGAFTFGFYSGVTSQTISICEGETLTVGSSVYTTTGNYLDILQDINSEDSIVITNLTVNIPLAEITFTNEVLNAVGNGTNYQWINCGGGNIVGEDGITFTPLSNGNYAFVTNLNGCLDTSDCLYYTIVDTTICNGLVYSVGTSNYSTEGTFATLLATSNLIDSLVVSHLLINAPASGITVSGIVLSAENTNASYQWLDCTNGMSELINETGQSYTPTVNGEYAVELAENSCVDTSICILINSVGLSELDKSFDFSIFPNPVVDVISIQTNATIQQLRIFNALGVEVLVIEIKNKLDLLKIPFANTSGVYFIELKTDSDTTRKKFINL